MPATDTVKAALERNWGMVDQALNGMDEAAMARRLTGTATLWPGLYVREHQFRRISATP